MQIAGGANPNVSWGLLGRHHIPSFQRTAQMGKSPRSKAEKSLSSKALEISTARSPLRINEKYSIALFHSIVTLNDKCGKPLIIDIWIFSI